jgi:poly(hydroxyalkanoate) granule-associated protein
MSDNEPTITVTRGKRKERSERKQSAARARSSGWGLPGPGALVSGVVRGVRSAWWAGLGVFSVARDAGAQVFDAFVEEGKSWEQEERRRREATAQQVQRLANEEATVEAIEERVREEVNDVLHHAGVPHRDEVEELRTQIDTLGEKIEQLQNAVSEAGGEKEG